MTALMIYLHLSTDLAEKTMLLRRCRRCTGTKEKGKFLKKCLTRLTNSTETILKLKESLPIWTQKNTAKQHFWSRPDLKAGHKWAERREDTEHRKQRSYKKLKKKSLSKDTQSKLTRTWSSTLSWCPFRKRWTEWLKSTRKASRLTSSPSLSTNDSEIWSQRSALKVNGSAKLWVTSYFISNVSMVLNMTSLSRSSLDSNGNLKRN
jgi:hypothetical protein